MVHPYPPLSTSNQTQRSDYTNLENFGKCTSCEPSKPNFVSRRTGESYVPRLKPDRENIGSCIVNVSPFCLWMCVERKNGRKENVTVRMKMMSNL